MNSIGIEFVIKDNYKDIIKKEINEPIILEIMNKSSFIFPDQYEHINNQSNGESDYKAVGKDEFYDLKTIYETEICHLISNKKLNEWLKKIQEESSQTFSAVMDEDGEENILKKISQTTLYEEFKKRLNNIKSLEKCVLFLPFPLSVEIEGSLMPLLSSSKYHLVVRSLEVYNPDIIKNKEVFIIYPNLENKVILRKLYNGQKEIFDIEFVTTDKFKPYIYITKISN